MKHLKLLPICLLMIFFSYAAFAADVPDVPVSDFISQAIQLIGSFFTKDSGSASWGVKIAAILTLVLSSTKVSGLSKYWDMLGSFKAYAAPALSIIVGVLAPIAAGQPVTLKGMAAFLGAGAGAIALHELLDTLKAIPGVNKYVAMFVDLVEGILGGKQPASSTPPNS